MEIIELISEREDFIPDYNELIRAFAPHIITGKGGHKIIINIDWLVGISANIRLNCFNLNGISEYNYENKLILEEITDVNKQKSEIKRDSKAALYNCLCEISEITLPYGALTGIRPTKLYHDLIIKGIDAMAYLKDYMKVSDIKCKLISDIVAAQEGIYDYKGEANDIFVNIPFCVSRCSYCSFICAEYGKVKRYIPEYIDILIKEIDDVKKMLQLSGRKVRCVYVGGGTPTSLSDRDFAAVLSHLKGLADEFTVEAGRPDTITESKLKIMDEMGVTRISINPQSFNDKTLALIGRSHSVSQVYDAFNAASKYNFDINTDLIAMLPQEGLEEFAHSVDCAIALKPSNITVHTLALKKGSVLKESGYDNKGDILPAKMIDYAAEKLSASEYFPYYMYRQKYMR